MGLAAMRWLAHNVVPGDVLFFLFSGHGTQVLDSQNNTQDAMDDAICPVDQQFDGQITDNQMFESLVRNLPAGVRLTAIVDTCVPGVTLKLPWSFDVQGWVEESDAYHTFGDAVCFSLQPVEDLSSELLRSLCALPGGVITTAFLQTLKTLAFQKRSVTYVELFEQLHKELMASGLGWKARLSVSQAFDPSRRPFRFSDAVPNGNGTVGLSVHRHHKAPRRWCGPDGVEPALCIPGVAPPSPYRGERLSPQL